MKLPWIPRIDETVVIDEQDYIATDVFYNLAFEAVDIELRMDAP